MCCGRPNDFEEYPHRHQRGQRLAIATGFCLLIATILIFLVTLSLPIINSVYLLDINAQSSSLPEASIDLDVRCGVWGCCGTRSAPPPPILLLPT